MSAAGGAMSAARVAMREGAMSEDELRLLLTGVPPVRRIQARAALTGSADALIGQVRAVRERPDGGWQAVLSAQYIAALAARYRAPAEVAMAAVSLRGLVDPWVMLDVAAVTRTPGELAVIVRELGRAAPGLDRLFLDRVATRRLPADLIALLRALPRGELARGDLIDMIRSLSPDEAASVILHLRGLGDGELIEELVAAITAAVEPGRLGTFLASLDRCGDQVTAERVIEVATSGTQAEAAGRVTDLVTTLLGQRNYELAQLAVTSAVRSFSPTGQQHQLYALLFVFTQYGLHEEAQRVRKEIRAAVPDRDEVDLISDYCQASQEEPENIINLLRAILVNPVSEPSASDAALRLANTMAAVRPAIFAMVSSWSCPSLQAFEEKLRNKAGSWSPEFLDQVADHASERDDAADIGDIVLWMLRGRAGPHPKVALERASRIARLTVRRREPELTIGLIARLRGAPERPGDKHDRWWTVRPAVAREIAESYAGADLAELIAAGSDRCLPALLWIATDWLARRPGRSDAEIVRVIRALREAHGDHEELLEMVEYAARGFYRPDGSHPIHALRSSDFGYEASAWIRGKNRSLPGLGRRPDPDRPS
jgi:hypothetical protein